MNNWPCNPEKMLVAHIPGNDEVLSFGSAYGGNALLSKKCMGLRLAGIRALNDGWLAEHMMASCLINIHK